jgi:GNAT superfamily N-acetyltransferase
MRTVTHPVEIRAAGEDDLPACLALDDSYTTAYTWQVEVVRGEPGLTTFNVSLNTNVVLGDSALSVTFRPVKLPRTRKVLGPIATLLKDGNQAAGMARLQAWRAADLVLVAEQANMLCGYLVLTVVAGSGIGWISSLVVANSMRRKGVGTMLMAAARRWARYGHGSAASLRALMLEVSIKNYPAVAFCRKEGFSFCGYTDYSFNNGDIVLLFASPIVI